jgi:hypothetical protein
LQATWAELPSPAAVERQLDVHTDAAKPAPPEGEPAAARTVAIADTAHIGSAIALTSGIIGPHGFGPHAVSTAEMPVPSSACM